MKYEPFALSLSKGWQWLRQAQPERKLRLQRAEAIVKRFWTLAPVSRAQAAIYLIANVVLVALLAVAGHARQPALDAHFFG